MFLCVNKILRSRNLYFYRITKAIFIKLAQFGASFDLPQLMPQENCMESSQDTRLQRELVPFQGDSHPSTCGTVSRYMQNTTAVFSMRVRE